MSGDLIKGQRFSFGGPILRVNGDLLVLGKRCLVEDVGLLLFSLFFHDGFRLIDHVPFCYRSIAVIHYIVIIGL